MKVEARNNKLNIVGDFEVEEFSVKASKEMFQVISDSLYSRKAEAIVRELSCNAYDSHVEAGRGDKPFDIKLPDTMNPNFYIRDYGTGLTPDGIKVLYSVFNSTKTSTNEQVGCFGLGSKSPFCYTDNFTVESIVDGTKWIYSVFLNEKGIPSFTQCGEHDTDEMNGLKVEFTVERDDRREFEAACQKVFKYFKIVPNFVGARKFSVRENVYDESYSTKLEGDDWKIVGDPSNYYGTSKTYAIMGNVAYEVDESLFGDAFIKGAELYFDLGELNPAASREYLQYDKDGKTESNIRKKFQKIRNDISERLEQSIKGEDNYLKACYEFAKVKKNNPVSGISIPDPVHKATGLKVQESVWVNEPECNLYVLTNSLAKGYKETNDSYNSFSFPCYQTKNWGRDVSPNYNVKFYYADQSYGKWTRSIHDKSNHPDVHNFYVFEGSESVLKKFLQRIGMDENDYTLISELEDPPRNNNDRGGSSDKAKKHWLGLTPEHSYDNRTYWEIIEKPEHCYYVEVNNYSWRFASFSLGFLNPTHLEGVVNRLKKYGVHLNVVGVKGRYKEQAQKNGWTPLEEAVKQFVRYMTPLTEDYTFYKTLYSKIRKYTGEGDLTNHLRSINSKHIVSDLKDEKLKEVLKKFRKSPDGSAEVSALHDSLVYLAGYVNMDLTSDKEALKKKEEEIKEVFNTYQLLDKFRAGCFDRRPSKSDIVELMNAVYTYNK